ncbi:hypothetical protein LITTLEDOG_4 [Serratia phage vB_SmaS_LittleDog]|uniref:Uncharacterized protein n=1 Tax=Serratia phage vB_SmaS_Bigdog TaxID=2777364 RepID=A0A7T3NA18_9CAUD|nr:hypothetical protein QJS28_gp04 [Serratia phage vB_SmaS_Bigdog]QPX75405.1 hypothetical protein [Serratia phage vB_SmaS_Opt-148]UGO51747.1 hypothetical protein SWAIN_4 [Serratia phage vB_SmaS_Swain]UGO51810.1 hypothetical protein CARROT_4 [Serratia phage vB_SmaS_Carrot]UGO53030.1 hypothetical protein LITTLEDOG_4 [Serratia phage vB_SmaS_LittleDog]QPX75110.1 hypothetical protein BIGDOG_4 [Serratia phage vB_SmaS_Bigdog]
MINGSTPKLHVITLEGFIMINITKGEGYDTNRALPVKTTLVEKKSEPIIYLGVSSSVVSISMSGCYGCTELSIDEAIKLFAGLLEDIKAASAEK